MMKPAITLQSYHPRWIVLPLLMATVPTAYSLAKEFIIAQDYGHRIRELQKEMGQWVKEDKIHYHEDITDGLENAPQTFIGLLKEVKTSASGDPRRGDD